MARVLLPQMRAIQVLPFSVAAVDAFLGHLRCIDELTVVFRRSQSLRLRPKRQTCSQIQVTFVSRGSLLAGEGVFTVLQVHAPIYVRTSVVI